MIDQLKNQIVAINNELQQVFVRGADAVHMANALVQLEQLFNSLPDDEKEETEDVSD